MIPAGNKANTFRQSAIPQKRCIIIITLFSKEHIPCRMLSKFTFEKETEGFATEINLPKVKWLLVCYYSSFFLI